MTALASTAAVAWILMAYAVQAQTGRTRPFNLANAVGSVPICLASATVGLWQHFTLTLFFGLIGAWGLIRQRQEEAS